MFIEILFKMLLFKGGVLIYAEHCSLLLALVHESLVHVIAMKNMNKQIKS